jgi:hypothetical protein
MRVPATIKIFSIAWLPADGGTGIYNTTLSLRKLDAIACTGCRRRVMPMLYWLPRIFMSALMELAAPASVTPDKVERGTD